MIPETTEASITEFLDDISTLGSLNDMDPDEDTNDSDTADEDISNPRIYHPAKRSCPVFLHQEMYHQTVDIHLLITDDQSHSIAFVKKEESV